MGKLNKILIMAGGTGGHVFPGLAVAHRMREKGIDVHWLGTEKGLEASWVPKEGFPLHRISISGVRGKGWKNWIVAPWRLLVAVYQSMKLIQEIRPDVILGMGGFVSGPGGIASWILRYPLVIHEQNAKPGLTNTYLAYLAKKVLEGFPNAFTNRSKVITTGNPVRTEIANLATPEVRFQNRKQGFNLLILGGSLGAAAINQLVPQALAKLPSNERPSVCHQTGEKHIQQTIKEYAQVEVDAEIKPFIFEMDKAYGWADIVICRAGALTIAELCAAGVGAILVPFPHAVDDHQTANANYMVRNNAATLIPQSSLTAQGLANLLKELYASKQKCVAMAQAAYGLRQIQASDSVLKICEEICQ